MRFRFMGLPIRRLPYLFAKSYNGEPTSDPARPAADSDQTESKAGGVASVTHKPNRSAQIWNSLSCPVNARHPVITDVSDYWIARLRGR
jgi:hypothetical protein